MNGVVVQPGLLDSPRITALEQRLAEAEKRIDMLKRAAEVDYKLFLSHRDQLALRVAGLQQAMTQLERDVAALQASSRRRATPAAKKRTRRPASAKRKSK